MANDSLLTHARAVALHILKTLDNQTKVNRACLPELPVGAKRAFDAAIETIRYFFDKEVAENLNLSFNELDDLTPKDLEEIANDPSKIEEVLARYSRGD